MNRPFSISSSNTPDAPVIRFALAWALTTLAGLGAVGAINVSVDVQDVYFRDTVARQAFAEDYAERLSRTPESLPSLLELRLVKLELARRSKADCIVIGSSRVMEMRRVNFQLLQTCGEITNLGVSGAGYEDVTTMLGAVARNLHAKQIFIGLDHWMLRRNADVRWELIQDAHGKSRADLGLRPLQYGLPPGLIARLKNLFNLGYLHRNVLQLMHHGGRPAGAKRDDAQISNTQRLNPDGSTTELDDGASRPMNRKSEPGYKVKIPAYDGEVVEEFQNVLNTLDKAGLKTHLLLVPLNPVVFDHGPTTSTAVVEGMERLIRATFDGGPAAVLGSYHPGVAGLGKQDYRDILHIKGDALPRLRLAN